MMTSENVPVERNALARVKIRALEGFGRGVCVCVRARVHVRVRVCGGAMPTRTVQLTMYH